MGGESALHMATRVKLRRNPAVKMEEREPTLPLLVAVTGHREIRPEQREQLEKQVRSVFTQLVGSIHATTRDKENPVPILLLTGLAEGADQLVSRVALEAPFNAQLVSVLPMPLEIYEKDFRNPEALKEFRELWKLSAYHGEVPASSDDLNELSVSGSESRGKQYEALGAYLAQHSYVLIALWDGIYRDKPGGTSQVVSLKLRGCMEQSPADAQGNRAPGRSTRLSTIGPVYHVVTPRVGEMQPADALEVKVHLPEGLPFAERELRAPRDDKATREVAKRLHMFNSDVRKYEKPLEARRKAAEADLLPAGEVPEDIHHLRNAYSHVDAMAVHFKKRSEIVLRFYFVLVLCAGVAGAIASYIQLAVTERISIWALLLPYLIPVIGIYIVFFISTSRQFHKRHLDYRALAEGLRVQIFWRLSGVHKCVADYYLQNQSSELDWIRIALRSMHMAAPATTPTELNHAVNVVRTHWINAQIDFYKAKAGEVHRTLKKIMPIGTIAINIAIVWGGIKIFSTPLSKAVESITGMDPGNAPHTAFVVLLILLSCTGPIAVAFLGYSHYRGLSELINRYTKMTFFYSLAQRNLDHFGMALAPNEYGQIRAEIFELGRESLTENSDWLIMHRGRRLDLPR
jgi:hypothetical protein